MWNDNKKVNYKEFRIFPSFRCQNLCIISVLVEPKSFPSFLQPLLYNYPWYDTPVYQNEYFVIVFCHCRWKKNIFIIILIRLLFALFIIGIRLRIIILYRCISTARIPSRILVICFFLPFVYRIMVTPDSQFVGLNRDSVHVTASHLR